MADEFDIIDIVFAATEVANVGITGYKDNSATGEKDNHYTVRGIGMETTKVINKSPVVNINIFIRKQANGMPNRSLMKQVKRKMAASLKDITHPVGMYWKSRIVWSEPLGEVKEGFDCTNIRLEVITELD